jgi:hypothetical protein
MESQEVLSQIPEERVAIYQCSKCKNVIGNDKFLVEPVKDKNSALFKGNFSLFSSYLFAKIFKYNLQGF